MTPRPVTDRERMTPTRQQTEAAWRRGNDAGEGFAPGCSDARDTWCPVEPGDETIDGAVRAYVAEGATIVYERRTSDEIAVVNIDGRLVGIGGDAAGNGAWAVILRAEGSS